MLFIEMYDEKDGPDRIITNSIFVLENLSSFTFMSSFGNKKGKQSVFNNIRKYVLWT